MSLGGAAESDEAVSSPLRSLRLAWFRVCHAAASLADVADWSQKGGGNSQAAPSLPLWPCPAYERPL